MHSHDVGNLLGVLAALLFGAALAGRFAVRCKLPSVLGELTVGMLAGTALAVSGRALPAQEVLRFLAELGVLLLLFEVGLETSMEELRRVGRRASLVALVGVLVPIALGVLVSVAFGVSSSWLGHLFLGATLSATSVGITARVLKDLGRGRSAEANVILGAAVIDDVLGLVLLGLLSALAVSASPAGEGASAALWTILKAGAYLLLVFTAGRFLVPPFLRHARGLLGEPGVLTGALVVCLAFSSAGAGFGLAPAVGAFFAGMLVDTGAGEPAAGLEERLAPLSAVFVPVFFVVTGLGVNLAGFLDPSLLSLTLALCAAAVAGKLVSGLAAGREANGWVVGVAMIPRGEVGLIFASMGASLEVGGQSLLGPAAYAASVAMVAVTTLLAPVVLGGLLRRPA